MRRTRGRCRSDRRGGLNIGINVYVTVDVAAILRVLLLLALAARALDLIPF
jgi:hypothetical protein